MNLPEWMQDTHLNVLRERVDNLPLEKLRLGRKTFRTLLQVTTLSVVSSLASSVVMAKFLPLPGAGLMSVVLFLANGFLFFGTTQEGWERAREDSPAYSYCRCEVLNATWALTLAAACVVLAVFFMLLFSLLGLFSSNSALENMKGGAMLGGFMILVYFPNYTIKTRGELLRALLGLLKGTGRRATSSRRNHTFLERLTWPDGRQGSLDALHSLRGSVVPDVLGLTSRQFGADLDWYGNWIAAPDGQMPDERADLTWLAQGARSGLFDNRRMLVIVGLSDLTLTGRAYGWDEGQPVVLECAFRENAADLLEESQG